MRLDLRATAPQATRLESTFTIDSGADLANPPQPGSPEIVSGNNAADLTAGTEADLDGPGTPGGAGYARVNARALAVGPSTTTTLDLVEIVDAGSGRCSINGTAVPAG